MADRGAGLTASQHRVVDRGRCDASSSRGHVGEGLQVWRVELGSPYAHAVRSELGAAIDRRLAGLIIIRLRRVWPLLKLVPASWIVVIVARGREVCGARSPVSPSPWPCPPAR